MCESDCTARSLADLRRHMSAEHEKGVFYCAHRDCQGPAKSGPSFSFMAFTRGQVLRHYGWEHHFLPMLKRMPGKDDADDGDQLSSKVKEVQKSEKSALLLLRRPYWQRKK